MNVDLFGPKIGELRDAGDLPTLYARRVVEVPGDDDLFARVRGRLVDFGDDEEKLATRRAQLAQDRQRIIASRRLVGHDLQRHRRKGLAFSISADDDERTNERRSRLQRMRAETKYFAPHDRAVDPRELRRHTRRTIDHEIPHRNIDRVDGGKRIFEGDDDGDRFVETNGSTIDGKVIRARLRRECDEQDHQKQMLNAEC